MRASSPRRRPFVPPALTRRLPGLRFETPPAARTEILPRMDIAAFIGFAASGPLNIPVKVEDEAEFQDIFGPDAPLAWDNETNQAISAYLAPAVRGFFRNGGQRCWVVRVAEQRPANTFPVPGLSALDFRDSAEGEKPLLTSMRAAFAVARSQGRWSDALMVSAILESEPVQVVDFRVDPPWILLTCNSPNAIAPGDLMRLQYDEPGLFMLLPVETVTPVEPPADGSPPETAGDSRLRTRVEGTHVVFLAASGLKQPTTATATVQLFDSPWADPKTWPGTIPADTVDRTGSPPRLAWPTGGVATTVTLCLELPLEQLPPIGASILATIGQDTLWLTVAQYEVEDTGGSPPNQLVRVTGPAWWTSVSPFSLASPPNGQQALSAERLTFALSVLAPTSTAGGAGTQTAYRLDGLGFGPAHPRYWNGLPADEKFFAGMLPDASATPPPLWSELARPRFPLAGIAPQATVFVPINMPYASEILIGRTPVSAPALSRDGLDQFKLDYFVDSRLARSRLLDLPAVVTVLNTEIPNEPLKGLHAAFTVEEVTLVAAPDAVHRGWVSVNPQLPVTRASSPLEHPEWWHFLPCDPPPPIPLTDAPPRGHFFGCGLELIPAPGLLVDGREHPLVSETGSFTLSWGAVAATGYFYLEEATAQNFSNAMRSYSGSGTSLTIRGRPSGDYFYRVRLIQGTRTSDWSNTIGVRVQRGELWWARPRESYKPDALLGVHRALLRACAARADALAVLSLPDHYLTDQVTKHVQLLAPSETAASGRRARSLPESLVPTMDYGEDSALSYGALYHPWSVVRTPDDVVLRSPPDGGACGILARRALERGAWIAPANEAWRGLVALTPLIPAADRLSLQQAQVNLLRQEPRGFLTLNADTLSLDDDLRPIHVRRLLILLRRLALALGPAYVFEPNDAPFRRLVQRNFEALLEGLFRAGAFAGATPAESFQVVTGENLNTPRSVEAGQFIVELRVAPAQPLTFVTVRLVQAGNGDLTVQGL
jgi:hypothetical protein